MGWGGGALLGVVMLMASARAHAEPIAFSPFLLTWDLLQEQIWRGWMTQFPLELAKWGQRVSPDGSALLLDANGEAKLDFRVVSELSPDRTSRIVEMGLRNMKGQVFFEFTLRTSGRNLLPYDLGRVRRSALPFALHDPGEEYSDLRITVLGNFALRIRTFTEVRGEVRHFKAIVSDDFDPAAVVYMERSSPSQRMFRYLQGGAGSLSVVKTRLPEQLQGTEEYFVNDAPIDARAFRAVFDSTVVTSFLLDWQRSFESLLFLLQYADMDFR